MVLVCCRFETLDDGRVVVMLMDGRHGMSDEPRPPMGVGDKRAGARGGLMGMMRSQQQPPGGRA